MALVICASFGYRTWTVNRQIGAMTRLSKTGATFSDHSFDYIGPDVLWTGVCSHLSTSPTWPQEWFGQWACFENYSRIKFVERDIDDESIRDLACLAKLRWLKILKKTPPAFNATSLSRLDNLHFVELGGDWVTIAHLEALAGLQQLEWIGLCGTGITNAEINHFCALHPMIIVEQGDADDLTRQVEWYESRGRAGVAAQRFSP